MRKFLYLFISPREAFGKLLYLLNGKKICKAMLLEKKELIHISKGVEIRENVIIRTFVNKVSIGKNSQIGPFSVIYGGKGVQIMDNVMIGPHCVIVAGQHDYKQNSIPMRFASSISKGPIIIENDVLIGAHCTILDGVTIGKGAVIGANSLVNKSVKAYDIVGGVPIKVIGSRIKKVKKSNK